jgi:hypothetical protein
MKLACAMAICAAVSVSAATRKNWIDRPEYETFTRAMQETDCARKVGTLLDWERLYPTTDFLFERNLMLAEAYECARDTNNAFARATKSVALDANNRKAMIVIVRLGPTLKTPSPDQIEITRRAAESLLVKRAELQAEVQRSASIALAWAKAAQQK